MLGAKRTAFEAGFSGESLGVADMASQLEHIRDYAFIETKGGSKGEKVDYVLCQSEDGRELRYAPLISKLKLNKKRVAPTLYQ